jgi:hypothetical protein
VEHLVNGAGVTSYAKGAYDDAIGTGPWGITGD